MKRLFEKLNLFIILHLFSLIFIPFNLVSQQDITIYSTDVAPEIDGAIDGVWNDYPSQSLENVLSGTISSDADLSAEFQVIWDNINIYLLVDITDDTKINDSEEIVWQDDAIEIYIDINNDKLNTYGADDYQFSFRHNDASVYGGNTAGIVFAESSKVNGYVMEIKIPWATLNLLSAESGQLHGLDVQVHDDDDGGGRDTKIAWYATEDNSWQDPSLFATALLHGSYVEVYRAEKPLFSENHGFYTKPFDLTITSAIPGAQIYYTVDGSDPRYSATSVISSSPTIIRIDPASNSNRGQTPAFVVRASVYKEGYDFSRVKTQTYIFVNQVRNQSNDPGHDWPSYFVNDQEIFLGVNQEVVNDERYTNLLDDALIEIPSFSLVTDNSNLWDADKGIYVNALEHGIAWERPASVELINPDGSKGFQIDAGIRIRGGYSRHDWYPKHAFRLFFRKVYGQGKLNYPLFDDEGVKSFDKIDLRCTQNYGWGRHGDEGELNTMNRDVFSRDLQFEIGQPSTRSRYYHLYINGMYWGIFQTQERPEARYAASYFGGNVSDYDVIKRSHEGGIEATDGTLNGWEDVWNLCEEGFVGNDNYYEIQGLRTDGTVDTLLPVLLDVDNLIDYMLIIFYTGNFDAPVSKFMDNKGSNNFYAINNKNYKTGFKFFAHDAEHTLITRNLYIADGVNENRVNIGDLTDDLKMTVDNFWNFHPQWLHYKLSKNEEYALRFADRAYKYLFNNGALTPDKLSELFISRTYQYDTAIIAESARWGDVNGNTPYTKDDDWVPIINEINNEWFPYRTDILIQQLKNAGLLPAIYAPVFISNIDTIYNYEIMVESGYGLQISNPNKNGTIYYTLNGTDPKESGSTNGGNQADLIISNTTIIKARIQNNSNWSPLHEISFIVDEDLSNLQLTEIHYHPLNYNDLDDREVEFIELKNTGNFDLNLTKASFVNGIIYTFNKELILAPNEFVVLASNSIVFENRYGFSPYGEYNGQLDNAGERITLIEPSGDTIFNIRYNDKLPWPKSPDGAGFSLVPDNNDINADWNLAENWRPSSSVGGSPGKDDPYIKIPVIYITEILTNSNMPETDAIELYNPNNTDVDIGGWFLTDDRGESQKWQIPFNTIIPAKEYKVVYEGHYEGDSMVSASYEFGSSFALSSYGDEVYLFSGNADGVLTGYEFGFDFPAFETGVSVGKHLISTGDIHYVAQKVHTLEAENGEPKVGPIVISAINYHPQINDFEYLQLLNISNIKINLFDEVSNTPWKVSGLNFEFPDSFALNAGETVYLVESSILPDDFRLLYNLDADQKILNYKGEMDNSGERISLRKALTPFYDDTNYIQPYVLIDRVKYNDNELWPDADGNGYVLVRQNITGYGNDPANWDAAPPALKITTISLTAGVEGIPYNNKLNAINGKAPYTWNIVENLPDGLILDTIQGIIYGNPESGGNFNLTIRVIDVLNKVDEVQVNLAISENSAPVAINDTISTFSNINKTAYILQNDQDVDNDKDYWDISIVANPENGTAVINSDKSITYIPYNNYTGSDQLTYEAADVGGSSLSTLYIDVLEQVNNFEIGILSSEDDAEEGIGSGNVNTNSTDLELVNDGNDQLIGVRFQNILIPQGTTITSAYLQFQTDETSADATSLIIQGENADSAYNYSDGDLISIRNTTTASVAWNPQSWNVEGERTELQKTPDLSGIIQEIINRSGWKYGNALAFIINGTGYRVAESFDGNQEGAPQLIIEYYAQPSNILAPIAVAGEDQLINNGDMVKLDGTSSYSLDGSLINYNWIIDQKPEASNVILSNKYSSNPTFYTDKSGTYRIVLFVDNGLISSINDTVYITATNSIPIAIAGTDQSVKTNQTVYLNGNASYDGNSDSLRYIWNLVTKPVGSTATIFDEYSIYPRFNPDISGIFTISLIVNDGISNSEKDDIIITVNDNTIPVAIAGTDINSTTGETIYLFAGGSYDDDDDALSYTWKLISKPAGSNSEISDTTSINPTILPDIEGNYVLSLSVNDGYANSSSDTVVLNAHENLTPIANAGADKESLIGYVIRLNGSESYDPDGDLIEYSWSITSQPTGSNIAITGISISNPSFTAEIPGTYVFSLVVFDGSNYSAVNQVTITVNNNLAPVANAGNDINMTVNEIIQLNGSGSYDPEKFGLTYNWSVKSKPSQGIAYISDASAIRPEFTTNVAGTFELQLIVNDGYQNSDPDIIKIISAEEDITDRIFSSTVHSINVYPNPANDILYIKHYIKNISDYEIYLINTSGQIAYYAKENNSNIKINLKELKKGFYILRFKNKEFVTNKRVLIIN